MENTMESQTIIQYTIKEIESFRHQVSNRLPLNVYNKIISYQPQKRSRYSKVHEKQNKFFLRNAEKMDTEKLELTVKSIITPILNKVTNENYDKLIPKLNELVELKVNKDCKTRIHSLLMSLLLKKVLSEGFFCSVYANLLKDLYDKIEIDYIEYLDNLLVDLNNINNKTLTKDYNTKNYDVFCEQLKDKDNYVNLFIFIGELYSKKMIEYILIKKYLYTLFDTILKCNIENSLTLEINALSIKNLLLKCHDKNFYQIVYPKFEEMKNNKQYKSKFRFILMDIIDNYNNM